jgi:hypothetical protein
MKKIWSAVMKREKQNLQKKYNRFVCIVSLVLLIFSQSHPIIAQNDLVKQIFIRIATQLVPAALNSFGLNYKTIGYVIDRSSDVLGSVDFLSTAYTADRMRLYWPKGSFDDEVVAYPWAFISIFNLADSATAQLFFKGLKSSVPGDQCLEDKRTSFHENLYFCKIHRPPSASYQYQVWTNGNYLFYIALYAPWRKSGDTLPLGDVLVPSFRFATLLADEVYDTSKQLGLFNAQPNTNPPVSQPRSAPIDTDKDGIPDSIDKCKSVSYPSSKDGCPPFKIDLRCGPDTPREGDSVVCTVQPTGTPDGEKNIYNWFVDGKIFKGNENIFEWNAASGPHTIEVLVKTAVSGKSASGFLNISVSGHSAAVVDNPNAGFFINYLACNEEVTSDDVLDCAVGFERDNPTVTGTLVVTWLVDGTIASKQSHADDVSSISIEKPAPGIHDIEVHVTDPRTSYSRVIQTTGRVSLGQNAMVPPDTQAAVALATLSGLGVWLWGQWWLSRSSGKVKPKSPIDILPSESLTERIYDGNDAKKILTDLKILDDLKKLDCNDWRNPSYRAKRDELMDTKFEKNRRVRSISYKLKPEKEGKQVIDEDSIVIIVEEPDYKPPLDSTPPKTVDQTDKLKQEPDKPKEEPKQEPKKKPPLIDKKEQELRENWRNKQKEFLIHQRGLDATRTIKNAVDNLREKIDLALKAKIKIKAANGIIDVADWTFWNMVDVGMYSTGVQLPPSLRIGVSYSTDFIKNVLKLGFRQANEPGYKASMGDAVELTFKPTGLVDLYKMFYGALTKDFSKMRAPGGMLKPLLNTALKKFGEENAKRASLVYGAVQKAFNAYQENSELTRTVQGVMKQRGQVIDFQNKLDSQIREERDLRVSAKKGVQSAWQDLQNYLARKAQKAGSR